MVFRRVSSSGHPRKYPIDRKDKIACYACPTVGRSWVAHMRQLEERTAAAASLCNLPIHSAEKSVGAAILLSVRDFDTCGRRTERRAQYMCIRTRCVTF